MLSLVALTVLALWFGSRLPKSFLPDEDQGYVYAGLQLPNAASLQRNDEVSRKDRGHCDEDAWRCRRNLSDWVQHARAACRPLTVLSTSSR